LAQAIKEISMSTAEQRLAELGITLPSPVVPIQNYVPFVRTGNLLVIAGQLCFGPDGKIAPEHTGRLGETISTEEGKVAARLSAINVLAQVKAAIGDLDKVVRCVRLGGFFNVAPGYGDASISMNGASDLMVEVFGGKGRHARTTIGCAVPRNAAAEVDGMFEVL
jgi:enamine deaminase RidA (YjgF/YER057c/UK114 family)